MKKLLAILGSPHESGTSAAMLDIAVQAAERAGWRVDRISLYQLRIEYCRGCRACDESGVCPFEDDSQRVARLLRDCDAVALSAPTYWANVPAAVKNLFDRLVGAAMKKTKAFPQPRLAARQRYLLLTSCDTPYPFSALFGQSGGTLRAMREFFKTAGMTSMGTVVRAGADPQKPVPGRIRRRIERRWK